MSLSSLEVSLIFEKDLMKDSGNGMTHGALGAILIRDLIMGWTNEWERLYEPSRKMTSELGKFFSQNIQTQVSYKEWLTGGEIRDIENLLPGEGAVIRSGLKKDAVYKDPSGEIFRCSAVCPHLGGIVSWNSFEKSWDCPAHGSRFDPYGTVINGPANCNLSLLDTHQDEAAKSKMEQKSTMEGRTEQVRSVQT